MNDSFLLLMNPNFAPYWGGQGPPPGPLLHCAYDPDFIPS